MTKTAQPKAAREAQVPAADRPFRARPAAGFADHSASGAATHQLIQIARQSPQAAQLRQLGQFMADSPHAIAQRRLLDLIGAKTAQREAMEEEEPLQGRFESGTVQNSDDLEEEEPLQGKFESAPIQKASALDEEEPLQGRFEPVQKQPELEEEEPLQARSKSSGAAQLEGEASKPDASTLPGTGNTGLPDNLKTGIESLSGIAMDDVKVHYNSSKPAQLNALAYAQGSDIHLAPRQEQHLPHEAWHVVQQAQGRVQPTMQLKTGVPVNYDKALERKADAIGEKARANTAQLQVPEYQLTQGKFAIVQRVKKWWRTNTEHTAVTGGAKVENAIYKARPDPTTSRDRTSRAHLTKSSKQPILRLLGNLDRVPPVNLANQTGIPIIQRKTTAFQQFQSVLIRVADELGEPEKPLTKIVNNLKSKSSLEEGQDSVEQRDAFSKAWPLGDANAEAKAHDDRIMLENLIQSNWYGIGDALKQKRLAQDTNQPNLSNAAQVDPDISTAFRNALFFRAERIDSNASRNGYLKYDKEKHGKKGSASTMPGTGAQEVQKRADGYLFVTKNKKEAKQYADKAQGGDREVLNIIASRDEVSVMQYDVDSNGYKTSSTLSGVVQKENGMTPDAIENLKTWLPKKKEIDNNILGEILKSYD